MAAVVDDTPLLISNHSGHEDEKELGFCPKFKVESKKLWQIAGPAIFTALCQYSLGALTQTFTGFVGELELAAVSVENSVIAGLAFGVMVSKFTFSLSSKFVVQVVRGGCFLVALNTNVLVFKKRRRKVP